MADVLRVDTAAQKVLTNIGDFEYDYLVIATGADTNFFGNSNMQAHAFPMKSTTEALQLRHRILHNFEDAVSSTDPLQLKRLMNIVVVFRTGKD